MHSLTPPRDCVILSERSESKDLRLLFIGTPATSFRNRAEIGIGAIIHTMQEHVYFTYIVASRSHTLYIGVTSDLRKRIFEHKWREHDGFTERYNCDRLVWFERYQEIVQAIAREKQLKGWRRDKKIALIEFTNPTWSDLSKDWYDLEPADLLRATDRMNT